MKKILIASLLSLIVLTGCGNKQLFDTKWTFNTAQILIKGEWKEVTIDNWNDYEDGVVQISTPGGEVYLTHYSNVVLIGR